MNFLYRATTKIVAEAIAVFSPRAAARYIHERSLLGGYDAARKTGSNKAWIPRNNTGTYENVHSAKFVRARARDLARNNSYIVGSIKKILANTIGSDLSVKFTIKNSDGTLNSTLNSDLERRFSMWAQEATMDGKTFHDLVQLVEQGTIVDGEILINQVVVPSSTVLTQNPIRFQVLETDYLDETLGVYGIDYDSYNKPIAYNLYDRYPEALLYTQSIAKTVKIPAESMILVYRSDRASTYRGISELAPIALGLHSIDELEAAELTAIRSASAFGVIVTSPFSSEILTQMYNEGDLNAGDEDSREMYVTPGQFHFLRPGEDAKAFKNERPNTNLMPFIKELLYKNSSALGVAAEEMSNDYSDVNYSSARQSALVARRLYKARRAESRRRYLNKIVQSWLTWEIITGKVQGLPSKAYLSNPSKYQQFDFTFPGFDWVDPLKEIKAAELEIQLGLNSRTNVCMDKNRSFEHVVDQLAAEKEYMKKRNVWGDDPTVTSVETESTSESTSVVKEGKSNAKTKK